MVNNILSLHVYCVLQISTFLIPLPFKHYILLFSDASLIKQRYSMTEDVFKKCLSNLMRNTSVSTLLPYLLKYRLVHMPEVDSIQSPYLDNSTKITNLLNLTKRNGGKNGFGLLYDCLFKTIEEHRGHDEIVQELKRCALSSSIVKGATMEVGLDPENEKNNGNTPIHIAAAEGHVETVRHLISKHSGDIDSTNNENNTPLMLAVLNGHAHVFDMLVKEFNISCHTRSNNGYTFLHCASEGGHIDLIDKLVIEYGLDLGDVDNNGNTPLHIAAARGRVETVRHLISEHSDDVTCTNNENNTPLMLAALNGYLYVLDMLVKEFNSSCHVRGSNGYTLLHYTCGYGHIELIDKLVMKYGLDPADRDYDGNTPLHIAAMFGHVETLRYLITQYSVEIDITNNVNSTPLCLATEYGHEIVIHAMIKEFNCNPHVRGYNGQTLLHYACQNGHVEPLNKLVAEYRVDPTIRDNDGNTPLHLLCHSPHTEEMLRTILYEYQYWTVFQVNNDGNTPLHTATLYEQARYARLLLQKYNAPLCVRNKDGKTALDLANAQRSEEIITIFKNHNSKIQLIYRQLDKLAKQEFGGEKNLTRLFVVGHPGAGKSTLVETIKKEGLISYFSTSTVAPHTAGIVPSTYDSSTFGRMILYDFAGDSEYHSSHAAIMESINTSKGSNIYLILCDLSNGEEAAATKYSYWLSFLLYNIKQFSNTIILPVGSHADVINKTSVEQTLYVLDTVSQKFCISSKIDDLHIEQSVALDCRKRGAVVNDIKELTKRFSKLVFPIGLSPETSTLLGLLKKDFEHVPACKVSLLKLEDIQWTESEGNSVTLGWYAKCDGDRFDFFPTRFLHVLIVRLSHNFVLKQSLPSRPGLSSTASDSLIAEVYYSNPRCRVWSTGLHWLMINGVEIFVNMPKDADSKELIVLARSDIRNQAECSETLHQVIQKVVEAKVEFCAGIVPTVYLLDPGNLNDEPFTNAINAPKYALRDIEEALAEGTERVMDKEGQCFSSTPIEDWISPTISYWSKFHVQTYTHAHTHYLILFILQIGYFRWIPS